MPVPHRFRAVQRLIDLRISDRLAIPSDVPHSKVQITEFISLCVRRELPMLCPSDEIA